MTHPILVIGGGVAGCAAAVALAQQGVPVVLYEASNAVGGVAARGEHRTICGLAPIDAVSPILMEPEFVCAWLPFVTTGPAYRHGRVWLWPTTALTLMTGLQQRLAHASVVIHYQTRVTAMATDKGQVISVTSTTHGTVPVRGVIDASGAGISARLLGLPIADATQWPAHRSILSLPNLGMNKAARVRALHLAQQAIRSDAALALSPVGEDRWQLSIDVPPTTTLAHAANLSDAIATALGGQVWTQAITIAVRDEGRPAAQLDVATLFAQTERGLCWASWPQEHHHAHGTTWLWPAQNRHGIPPSAVQLNHGPRNLWLIGKGMPVDDAAASALRVTGTCFALGAAVAAQAARSCHDFK